MLRAETSPWKHLLSKLQTFSRAETVFIRHALPPKTEGRPLDAWEDEGGGLSFSTVPRNRDSEG